MFIIISVTSQTDKPQIHTWIIELTDNGHKSVQTDTISLRCVEICFNVIQFAPLVVLISVFQTCNIHFQHWFHLNCSIAMRSVEKPLNYLPKTIQWKWESDWCAGARTLHKWLECWSIGTIIKNVHAIQVNKSNSLSTPLIFELQFVAISLTSFNSFSFSQPTHKKYMCYVQYMFSMHMKLVFFLILSLL